MEALEALETTPGTPSATCATQPLGRALRLLGDTPTLIIVYTLLRGARRFGEIQAELDGVSPKTIVQRLKALDDRGFLRRHAYAEIPPRVEYDLTEKGFALADIMAAIEAFGARYLADSPVASATPPTSSDACALDGTNTTAGASEIN
jgi:DNA-binding HxlR family transcriptional regulator